MSQVIWRPANEAEATSNLTAVIEFARARGGSETLSPACISRLRAENSAEFQNLLAAFCDLHPSRPLPPDRFTRVEGPGAAARIAAMLKHADWPTLLASLAAYLIDAEIRPDDQVVWTDPSDNPWPLGALAAGARLLLAPRPPG